MKKTKTRRRLPPLPALLACVPASKRKQKGETKKIQVSKPRGLPC